MRFLAKPLAVLVGVVLTAASAQAPLPESTTGAEVLAALTAAEPVLTAELPDRVVQIDFSTLGGGQAQRLRGFEGEYSWPLGIRLDEVVTAAKLRLRYTYSPSMLPALSHLAVSINGEVVTAVPLPTENAGKETVTEIPIDAGLFTDYNQINVQLIGHYTTGCEDPLHSSLWASISGKSQLELSLKPVALTPDLARLPAPFLDVRDAQRLELPVLLAARPSAGIVQAAAIAAGWFGAKADFRSARFPTLLNTLPQRHALVFATNSERPSVLDLPNVEVPTLRVMDHPTDARIKLLVVQGRDTAQLQTAATALALGQFGLSGAKATVTHADFGERRPAYDAPRWLSAAGPTRLGDLVDNPSELQANGHAANPIDINVRFAPDLFFWQKNGLPLSLTYRYTPPVQDDNSMLTVSMNDLIVKSLRLVPAGESRLGNSADPAATTELVIPPYQLGSDNRLSIQFGVDYHRPGPCRDSGQDLVRSAIDPNSTIDISRFAHYASLPDLAMFANASFPFSKYADLAETAIVLPASATATDIEAALFVVGRVGRHTGAPGTRVQVVLADDLKSVEDKDLVVIGGAGVLEGWGESLAMRIEKGRRGLKPLSKLTGVAARFWQAGPVNPVNTLPTWSIDVTADGELAALLGFESPLASARSVVALTANSPKGLNALLDALEHPGQVRNIAGDAAIIRNAQVESFKSSASYTVGSLPLSARIGYFCSRHPWLFAVFLVLSAVLLGLFMIRFLRAVARQRLS